MNQRRVNSTQNRCHHPQPTKEEMKQMRNIRIIQRNLLYIVGLPKEIASKELLLQDSFLGQYGKVIDLQISRGYTSAKNKKEPKFLTCHVTYPTEEQTALAILALNGLQINDTILVASFGMTRYCCYFLRREICPNDKCQYVHKRAEDEDCCDAREKTKNLQLKQMSELKIARYLTKNNFKLDELEKDQVNQEYFFFPNLSYLKSKLTILYENITTEEDYQDCLNNSQSKLIQKFTLSENNQSELETLACSCQLKPDPVEFYCNKQKNTNHLYSHDLFSNKLSQNSSPFLWEPISFDTGLFSVERGLYETPQTQSSSQNAFSLKALKIKSLNKNYKKQISYDFNIKPEELLRIRYYQKEQPNHFQRNNLEKTQNTYFQF